MCNKNYAGSVFTWRSFNPLKRRVPTSFIQIFRDIVDEMFFYLQRLPLNTTLALFLSSTSAFHTRDGAAYRAPSGLESCALPSAIVAVAA